MSDILNMMTKKGNTKGKKTSKPGERISYFPVREESHPQEYKWVSDFLNNTGVSRSQFILNAIALVRDAVEDQETE